MNRKTILLSLPLIALSAVAGQEHGGGNPLGSSAALIEARLSSFPLTVAAYRGRVWESFSKWESLEVGHHPVLRKIIGSPANGSGDRIDLSVPPLRIEREKPCFDHGAPKAASTDFKPGSPICVSIPELLKLDPYNFDDQLGALIMHELAHQNGEGEADATAIQEYLLFRTTVGPALDDRHDGISGRLEAAVGGALADFTGQPQVSDLGSIHPQGINESAARRDFPKLMFLTGEFMGAFAGNRLLANQSYSIEDIRRLVPSLMSLEYFNEMVDAMRSCQLGPTLRAVDGSALRTNLVDLHDDFKRMVNQFDAPETPALCKGDYATLLRSLRGLRWMLTGRIKLLSLETLKTLK